MSITVLVSFSASFCVSRDAAFGTNFCVFVCELSVFWCELNMFWCELRHVLFREFWNEFRRKY